MGWLLRSECWLIICILFTELVLPSVQGSEDAVLLILNTGTNSLPSPQFSSDAALGTRNAPTLAPITEEPTVKNVSHSLPPSHPPDQTHTKSERSVSSSPVEEAQPHITLAASPLPETTHPTSPASISSPPPTSQTATAASPSSSNSVAPPIPQQTTDATSPSTSTSAPPPMLQTSNATSPSASVSSAAPPIPQEATNVSSLSPSNFAAPPLPQTTNATSPSASISSAQPPTPQQARNVSSPSPSNLAAPPLSQNTNGTSNGMMPRVLSSPPVISSRPPAMQPSIFSPSPSSSIGPHVKDSPRPVSAPPRGLEVPVPVSAPPVSDHQSDDNRNSLSPPSSDQGHLHSPVSSPSRSLHRVPEAPVLSPTKAVPPPSMAQSNHSLPPLPPSNALSPSPTSIPHPNRSLPPSPAPVHQPNLPLPPSPAPVHQPKLSLPLSPAPMHKPKHSLSPSPALLPRPQHMLPPPPPNLDCTSLTCMDPLTNSPPGSPCGCVRPMKVGLRLSVALYTFFPLVSELAKEIAFGTLMKQSQVRIMGANAATEQPDKSIVLVDLVPLGEKFDATTAYLTSEKFWHKQVGIKASYFGEYDVLYVIYPGLPPSPPMSSESFDVDGGSNENNSRRIHPLGVDVRKRKERLGGSLITIIVLSSAIALVLSLGVAWLLFLKPKNGGQLCGHTPRTPLPLFSKGSGGGPTAFGSCPSSVSGSFSSSLATYTGSAKTFTAAEIERATSNFDDSKIIGEGGFGRVYQGILDDETKVAVKVLKRDDQQGSREFLAEVEMLSRLHHRNLVKLIGICTEEHFRCLVYELIVNGSVESHLHGTDKEIAPLDWAARMKIALGSARGLAYLHEDSSPRVIHRDFKSSNILLECDFTPKVSDFGLARTALDEGNGHISTRVMGTFGYVAPEYAMTGHLLVKSDVYSYGVVLLEILTGRKPVDMLRPPGQENLVTWARPLLTSREGLDTVIDPALGSSVPFDSMAKVAAIASMCVQSEVSHRPFMGEVVQALKLVCNENDEHRASESFSQGATTDHDPEIRISSRLVPEADKVLSASEIFSTSAKDASGSFRRHSSSGPLSSTRSAHFWQRLRGLPRGSTSDHGPVLKSRSGGRRWL